MDLHKMKLPHIKWRIAQFLELWWWHFYLKKKDSATYLTWKKNYWQSAFKKIEEHFIVQPHQEILELGCGPAGCFIHFTTNKITAIDPLISSYEKKIPFFNKRNFPNTTFVNTAIETAEINRKFEVVLCFNAINHVCDINNCLNKIYSWISPNGKVLLSVDAHNYSFLKKIFAAFPGDVLHPHQYTLQEYLLLCRKTGLLDEKVVMLSSGSIFSHYLIVLSAPKKIAKLFCRSLAIM